MLVIEECANTRAVTIFVRGGNKMVNIITAIFSMKMSRIYYIYVIFYLLYILDYWWS